MGSGAAPWFSGPLPCPVRTAAPAAMVSTSTQIAGFDFDNCLMNAAGVACMTIEELAEVKDSVAGTFVTKTATLEFRQGNPEPRYQDVPLGSINSMGLPNNGLDYYLDYLLELQESEPNRTFMRSAASLAPPCAGPPLQLEGL